MTHFHKESLAVARLYAGWHLGDPTWANTFADILADPSSAEESLREALGDDYDAQLALRDRQAARLED